MKTEEAATVPEPPGRYEMRCACWLMGYVAGSGRRQAWLCATEWSRFKTVNTDTINRLAETLGVPVTDLIEDAPDPNKKGEWEVLRLCVKEVAQDWQS